MTHSSKPEYAPLDNPAQVSKERANTAWRIFRLAAVTTIVFSLWSQILRLRAAPQNSKMPCSSAAEFNWYDLTPSEDIKWTDCFDGQKCARLSLPLDYLTPEGPKTEIALRMIPASSKTEYSGTILVNPGGPGGSGTDLIQRKGEQLSTIAGPTFDILGFDPRGTGASTPSAQCFDSAAQYKIWNLQGKSIVNISTDSVPITLARSEAEGDRCLQAIGGNGLDDINGTAAEWGIGRFMGTASVATDMFKITEKLGQDKLKYWGFSYGTVLGQFYAAMYPDKISRLVIDGVAEGYDYRNVSWSENIYDIDTVIGSFYAFCSQAGSEKCPMHDKTPEAIKSRVEDIFAKLQETPIAVPFTKDGPAILTPDLLQEKLFTSAYAPLTMFAPLARILRGIETGNQTLIQEIAEESTFACSCGSPGSETPPWKASNEAWSAIACGDGPLFDYDPDKYEQWYNHLLNQSAIAGPAWASAQLQCAGWKMEAKWKYLGALTAENTSHPILVTNPKYDPVTPARNAEVVHTRYGGAGLLIQDSYGHCTLSAPSLCKAKAVRKYFVDGTLPEKGLVCAAEEFPFVGNVTERVEAMSVEDRELLQALRGLSEEVWGKGAFGRF